ncbi:MAG: DNA mismatch repair endonuclease MutL [Desulfatibacillaceae bacterium]
MTRIRILPEILSNKIAAGEVVERPASVLKELVENSLDAGAGRVVVEVEKGGRNLVRVSDNGVGMEQDDAILALERYATSKLASDEELFAIRTLGFRGEALPSIASVSRFTLVTRPGTQPHATEIVVEGGKIKSVRDTGAPVGTTVTVHNLFFNTPARRKFMKTVGTEFGHVADTLSSIALGHPGVHFSLSHGGKSVFSWPATEDSRARVLAVLGRDMEGSLYPVALENDFVRATGWLAGPDSARSNTRGLYTYVNGRFVRDRVLAHAATSGYGNRLMKGRYPVAVLFVEVPRDEVDVNVHPAKAQVRFARQDAVHDGIARAVDEALGEALRKSWGAARGNVAWERDAGAVLEAPVVARTYEPAENRDEPEPAGDAGPKPPPPAEEPAARQVPAGRAARAPAREREAWGSEPPPCREQEQTPLSWTPAQAPELRVIGQMKNSYILCESGEGLLCVDQHAAHERVLFEQYKRALAENKVEVQALLIPEQFELSHGDAETLDALLPGLADGGLEIERFSGRTFVIKACPAFLGDRELYPLVLEMVERVSESGALARLAEALDECLILVACHGAVRARQSLSSREMEELLASLSACDNPSQCPHGRPTWISLTLTEIHRRFRRK